MSSQLYAIIIFYQLTAIINYSDRVTLLSVVAEE